jgi:hypothetical protein
MNGSETLCNILAMGPPFLMLGVDHSANSEESRGYVFGVIPTAFSMGCIAFSSNSSVVGKTEPAEFGPAFCA